MLQRLTKKIPREQIAHLKQHWLTVSFVFGFIGDIILLNQIDSVVDNLILLFSATTATISFLLLYVAAIDRLPKWLSDFLKKYAPMAMQYGFGGLLSGMLVFYGRSGDWLASAPFLLVIVAVIFGNEFIKKRSDRFIYHLALYYIGMFSYIVLVVPVVLGKMGDGIFILSGLIALAIVVCVVQLLYRIVPNFMMTNTKRIILTMGFVYIGFNSLYFANIIPPIPLSLTKLEVTHGVVRLETGDYRVVYEEQPWWRAALPPVIHPSGTVACFARVYAPTKLSTNIYHRWEFKNTEGKWQEHARISYQVLSSGTLAGYRGYTQIASFSDGEWRCSVETARGAVLGRETFYIKASGTPGTLVTRIE
ncbi:MAG: DUF2914 domain-containing protein [Patescibacteria group bacterium]